MEIESRSTLKRKEKKKKKKKTEILNCNLIFIVNLQSRETVWINIWQSASLYASQYNG